MKILTPANANVVKVDAAKKDQSYRVKGGNVGVLLIHGLCGTPSEMRYVANGLAQQGYTVYCPQLAGHCGSAEEMKASTWEDWYCSAEAALMELRETCDTVIVGGLSTGALLSLLLAARNPALVQGLALLAPTLWVNGWNIPWYMRLFKLIPSRRLANMIDLPDRFPHGIKCERIRKFFADALFGGDQAGAGLPHTPGGAALEHRRLGNFLKPRLGEIAQPTLILHPREDDLADINNRWYLQRAMKGMVELVALNDSYHNVTIDKQRQVVVDRVKAFVAGLVGTSNGARAQQPVPNRVASVGLRTAVA
ncbi:MAG: alpha/beta fold hydrolase [Hyphomicrobiaceae bacterium]|nr:alpha/beta fold hydrolase [Hyphomicrobiaceae bacterium]